MDYQAIFKRHEIKYLLTKAQYDRIRDAMGAYMAPDQYGLSTIRNIYYDTDSFALIRHSMDKPVYKEKLRLRSYRQIEPDGQVYVELKKKYKGVVYKRRLSMPQDEAMDWLAGNSHRMSPTQIGRELEYFRSFYKTLHPTVYLSYDRTAWFCDGSDFRVTFDTNIRYRTHDLSLSLPPEGISILPHELVLMELKTSGGLPLWMTRVLTQEKIFKTSYSKYANAYTHMMKGEFTNAR